MRVRCLNVRNTYYKDYGGRGIKICERWNSYENFLADMGRKPTPAHTIDRIDNEKGYEPGNCRWATPEEQSNNTRKNVFVFYHGERLTIAQLMRKCFPEHEGASAKVRFYNRRAKGWSVEDAIDIPPTGRGHKDTGAIPCTR